MIQLDGDDDDDDLNQEVDFLRADGDLIHTQCCLMKYQHSWNTKLKENNQPHVGKSDSS